uniref:Uncharacterized protein n=1 Tax=Panagrolaimus davidi TaxID=227884 RepID=A0A914QNN6_9BILA
MYKIKAYRASLKHRHQILENVKVLKYLFPTIFIHTLVSPLGSIIAIVDSIVDFMDFTPATMFIFYNLAILLICIRHIFVQQSNSKTTNVTVVKNALGKSLPKMFTTDNYFQDLQHQWK